MNNINTTQNTEFENLASEIDRTPGLINNIFQNMIKVSIPQNS